MPDASAEPVVIRWLDACRTEQLVDALQAGALRPIEVEDTGWVVSEDKDTVVLATGRVESLAEGTSYRVVAIPKILVRGRKPLRRNGSR